jgi:ribosomal protein S18 acetylase RimI-like enzyme
MKDWYIRKGTVGDLPFLKDMLYEAIFWDSRKPQISSEELFANPDIARILQDWGKRKGDFSLIAVDKQDNPIGAVWYRFWTRENHTYGFVDEEIPELGISVSKEFRGKGVGRDLMTKIINHAEESGVKSISLSVAPENFALRLYEKIGFKKVSESGTSWTLLKII